MPRLSCRHCSKFIDFSGDRPSFCAYCGQSLGTPDPSETMASPSPDRGSETVDHDPAHRPSNHDVPERVAGYRLIRQIGRGGMGTVFEAEDSRHGRHVAIKIIAPGYVASPTAVERFRQEGRLASSLAHPRCVFVLEADEDVDGRPYIAMELMTGDTLQDLVEKGGAPAVGDAVAKILDVIDGLREAHRVGLIHRDVKPSNCFLDGDGRVKVGDFGLSKTQSNEMHLTRTGTFLGTPLYASPEQIKVEPLDERTDIYSTAATLFFLLTGRAPFDRGTASGTMASIVSDPAPSAREIRPEVSLGLDRIIRKGLERDRARRYRDLDGFRAALLPYRPAQVPSAGFALRTGAYLFDYAVTFATIGLMLQFVPSPAVKIVVNLLAMVAYFALADGIWGGSIGKCLLRLRVVGLGDRELVGVRRATLRTIAFLVLAELPINLTWLAETSHISNPGLWLVVMLIAEGIGLAVIGLTMVRRADVRGPHDLLAGTRVIALPRDDRRRTTGSRRVLGRERGSMTRPVGVMQSVGPYKVRGAVRWEANRKVVAGEDSTLGREAWIVFRPKGSPPPEAARRDVARATRPRWLNGGEQAEGRWDAYIAPAGTPLADLAGPEGLPWRDARPILEDLADELAAACLDGTLPDGLTVDQVWLQPDGRAILVDPLAIADEAGERSKSDDDRSLSLLRRVAAMAIEGGRSRSDSEPKAIRGALPVHASSALGRLLGGPGAYSNVAGFRDDLESTRHLPTEVDRTQKGTYLAISTLLGFVGLVLLYLIPYLILSASTPAGDDAEGLSAGFHSIPAEDRVKVMAVYCSAIVATWTAWSAATRGGFALGLTGLAMVRYNGGIADRWRCGWLTLVSWLVPAGLLVASAWASQNALMAAWSCWVFFGLAIAMPPISAILSVSFPSGWVPEWLSGVRIAPM